VIRYGLATFLMGVVIVGGFVVEITQHWDPPTMALAAVVVVAALHVLSE
jgi:hypothetical protein